MIAILLSHYQGSSAKIEPMNDQRKFQNRLLDLAWQAMRSGRETASYFLTPAEQAVAKTFLLKRSIPFSLAGGFDAAERARCLFWAGDAQPADAARHLAVTEIIADLDGNRHRDYLGALLGLGLRREDLGDILVKPRQAIVIHHPRLSAFISTQLTHVGSVPVQCTAVSLAKLINESQPEIQQAKISVSSLRADVVLGAVFHCSRKDSMAYFQRGLVQVDWSPCEKPDQLLKAGQVLTVRGCGRIHLICCNEISRKGKIRLVYKKAT